MIITLDEIQAAISARVDFIATAPSSTDTEYIRRTSLINSAAEKWGTELYGRWGELYEDTTLATVAGQSYVLLPDGLTPNGLILSELGKLTIGNNSYKLVRADQQETYDASEYIVWITGNLAQGYRLNISPTPSAVISFPLRYYTRLLATDSDGVSKSAMSLPTDKTKCPNPMYLVCFTLSEIYKTEGSGVLGQDYSAEASELLQDMKANNNTQVNISGEISDLAEVGGYPNIGN